MVFQLSFHYTLKLDVFGLTKTARKYLFISMRRLDLSTTTKLVWFVF